jgi:VWFA-related protein
MRHFARRKKPVAFLFIALLLILGVATHGQTPAQTAGGSTANPRALNVTALDEKGQPVTDLDSKDFQVYEDNKVQAITDFYPPMPPRPGKAASATLILFDLLNTVFTQRENSTTQIVTALQPLEASDSIFFYVLSNRGEWYPVRALYTQSQGSSGSGDNAPWTRQIRPLLDQTIDKVNALRIEDYKDQGGRSAATFLALNQIGNAFVKIPGPKTLVWLTRGAPNWVDYPYGCKDVPFPDGTGSYIGGKCTDTCTRRPGVAKCVDYTAFLAGFGARLARTDTVFSSVIINPQGALPPADRGRSRDTLQQLANVSGGQVYLKGEIERAIAEALQGGRARYQLTYNGVAPDGKYHKVRVECSRKGVSIEAPQGYYAEDAKAN